MIPKSVHQIWLGKNPIPEVAATWRASIPKFLPDWQHHLWTDADLPDLAKKALCPRLMLDESLGMGIRPDVIRYEILRQHGGLYLDHDMELLGPLEEIMMADRMHFGFAHPEPGGPGTAILASPARHPFWEGLLRDIDTKVHHRPENPWDVLSLTGPDALGRAISTCLEGDFLGRAIEGHDGFTAGWIFERGDLIGWSRHAVYPYFAYEMKHEDFRASDFPNAYAAHHWQGEWFREDSEFKAERNAGAE